MNIDLSDIKRLCNLFDQLQASKSHFQECSYKDDLPVYLPEREGREINNASAKQAAIDSLCSLWFDDYSNDKILSGLLCCSKETISAAETFNQKKALFKQQIIKIRDNGNNNKGKISLLIEQIMSEAGRRNKPLVEALEAIRISRLDLTRCYTQLRVLPDNLDAVSWTWAQSHTESQQVTRNEAVELAKSLINKSIDGQMKYEFAMNKLALLPESECLAYKRTKNKQLRANISWLEDDKLKRKAVTVSGVLLYESTSLPRLRWPDESKQTRLQRLDKTIEDDAYIESLRLFRYKSTVKSHK